MRVLQVCWLEIGELVWEIWCCLKRFGNGGLDLVGFGDSVRSLSCSLPELVLYAATAAKALSAICFVCRHGLLCPSPSSFALSIAIVVCSVCRCRLLSSLQPLF
ncbi:hypothetical protein Syun_001338 [Stephania yunnanensis]|uniref:Uncharacterized protein n=1 Tax=Stephania yunnanensis TaxID=152371 RepID=A0AAP0LDN8_9MAGN